MHAKLLKTVDFSPSYSVTKTVTVTKWQVVYIELCVRQLSITGWWKLSRLIFTDFFIPQWKHLAHHCPVVVLNHTHTNARTHTHKHQWPTTAAKYSERVNDKQIEMHSVETQTRWPQSTAIARHEYGQDQAPYQVWWRQLDLLLSSHKNTHCTHTRDEGHSHLTVTHVPDSTKYMY